MPELIVVLSLLVLIIWPVTRILRRAGFSAWLAVLAIIPGANLALLFFFAFAPWPSQRTQQSA